jgi:hypothetical protein
MDNSFLDGVLSVMLDTFKSVWGIVKDTLGTAITIGRNSLREYKRWK